MEHLKWFIDPVQHQYADFSGRATRQQFWMYVLVYLVLYIAASIVLGIVGLEMLVVLLSLAVLVPSLAISARRLHDTGLTGWLQLLGLIPFLGIIIMIILLARKGTVGSNQYGPDPLAHTGGGDTGTVVHDVTPDTPVSGANPGTGDSASDGGGSGD